MPVMYTTVSSPWWAVLYQWFSIVAATEAHIFTPRCIYQLYRLTQQLFRIIWAGSATVLIIDGFDSGLARGSIDREKIAIIPSEVCKCQREVLLAFSTRKNIACG